MSYSARLHPQPPSCATAPGVYVEHESKAKHGPGLDAQAQGLGLATSVGIVKTALLAPALAWRLGG